MNRLVVAIGAPATQLISSAAANAQDLEYCAARPGGEADAAPDADGRGRHAAFSTIGRDFVLSEATETTIKVQSLGDRAPLHRTTQWLGALSFGWKSGDDL